LVDLVFKTNLEERMKIKSTGDVVVNNALSATKLYGQLSAVNIIGQLEPSQTLTLKNKINEIITWLNSNGASIASL
jgi:hypothetical protein